MAIKVFFAPRAVLFLNVKSVCVLQQRIRQGESKELFAHWKVTRLCMQNLKRVLCPPSLHTLGKNRALYYAVCNIFLLIFLLFFSVWSRKNHSQCSLIHKEMQSRQAMKKRRPMNIIRLYIVFYKVKSQFLLPIGTRYRVFLISMS